MSILRWASIVGSIAAVSTSATAFAAAQLQVAPGREVLSLTSGVGTDVNGAPARVAVATPDGGAVIVAGPAADAGFFLDKIKAGGALDPAFGFHGQVQLVAGGPHLPFAASQIVRQPDGKLIVVGQAPATGALTIHRVLMMRLTAAGVPDNTFGTNGVAETGVGLGGSIALTADASVLVAGTLQPGGADTRRWVLTRLTPAGAIDSGFGQAGIVTISQSPSSGRTVAVAADGRIVTAGEVGGVDATIRLLPDGAPDPAFNAGQPANGGAGQLVLAPDDTAFALATTGAMARFTASGIAASVAAPSPGLSLLPAVPAAAGASLVSLMGSHHDQLALSTLGSDGAVATAPARPSFRAAFGGDSASDANVKHPALPLDPAQATAAGAIRLTGGDYLVFGGTTVVDLFSNGDGVSTWDVALMALTPQFTVDSAFGGSERPLTIHSRPIDASVSQVRARRSVPVRVTLPNAGTAHVTIRAHGKVIAVWTRPFLNGGTHVLSVKLTKPGQRALRHTKRVAVTATIEARNLLGRTATAQVSGTLR